jgi:hypothetical protein
MTEGVFRPVVEKFLSANKQGKKKRSLIIQNHYFPIKIKGKSRWDFENMDLIFYQAVAPTEQKQTTSVP